MTKPPSHSNASKRPAETPSPWGGGSMTRWFLWALLALLGVQMWQSWSASRHTKHVDYSELRDAIADGRFERVVIAEEQVVGTLRDEGNGATEHEAARDEPGGAASTGSDDSAQQSARAREHVTEDAAEDDGARDEIERWAALRIAEGDGLVDLLEQHDVPYAYSPSSDLWPWLLGGGLLLLLLPMLAARRGAGAMGPQGLLGVGRSTARVQVEPDTGTTFDDVAGADEAVDELRELVMFLERPERYRAIGARIPKGVLLVGPPGTGKTLLARAVAGHAGVPFFSLSGSEFMEMFVGVGAARVRDLFKQASQRAPAIIFIDEIDALAKSRGAGGVATGGHDEREQTLNQLLSEMDGFDPRQGLIVLAATNRPEVLDPALLRPGRFDRQVLVDRPTRSGRQDILKIHTQGVKLEPDVDLEELARRTPGFAGADLANVVNEAALLAVRHGRQAVSRQDLEEAIERVMAGLRKKSSPLTDDEKRRVAVHEAGHAIVSLALPHADPVHKVSIVSRGFGALGYTLQLPDEDRALATEPQLRDRLAVLLGGRAAERRVLGNLSTGAADDIRKASGIARAMVAQYGMSDSVGPIALDRDGPPTMLGSRERPTPDTPDARGAETAQRLDDEVARIVAEAERRADQQLTEHADAHAALVQRLIEDEVVGREELDQLLQRNGEPEQQKHPASRTADQQHRDDADADGEGGRGPSAGAEPRRERGAQP